MRRCVIDIETNGLLHQLDTIWVAVAYDIDSKEWFRFSDHSPNCEPLADFVPFMKECRQIIGHNFIAFDKPAIKMVLDYDIEATVIDTFLMSQILCFNRRLGKHFQRHGLEYWGEAFRVPKPKITQWMEYDEYFVHRCSEDVRINTLCYGHLIKEAKEQPESIEAFRLEFEFAEVIARQSKYGWLFDSTKAKEHLLHLDREIERLRQQIEPMIPVRVKPKLGMCTWKDFNKALPNYLVAVPHDYHDEVGRVIRPIAKPSRPKYLKSGVYDSHTCKYFSILPESAFSDKMVMGPYSRVEFIKSTMASHEMVKKMLLAHGWKPTAYNYQKDSDGSLFKDPFGRLVKKSPKLTPDSFDSIEGKLGEDIGLYNTLVNRRQTIENPKDNTKGWLNNLKNGRISAEGMTCGTATYRVAHRGIVNIPGNSAVFGREMRELFICEGDRVLVGADADALQLRLLAAHMGDDDYTSACVSGIEYDHDHTYVGSDIHTLNTRMAGLSNEGMSEKQLSKARSTGKSMIYALIFGAGDAKLGDTISQGGGVSLGKKTRKLLMENLPKMEALIDRVKQEVHANTEKYGRGFLKGADGRRIQCDQPHKAMNYLLQSDEAIIMKLASIYADRLIKKHGLDAYQVAHIHDEFNFSVSRADSENMRKIAEHSILKAGKKLGFEDLITGSALIGRDWSEIH